MVGLIVISQILLSGLSLECLNHLGCIHKSLPCNFKGTIAQASTPSVK